MRPVHIIYDRQRNCIFASTNRGTILKFDSELRPLANSYPIYNLNSCYVLKDDADHLYAREITGKLVRWRKDDLFAERVVDLNTWCPPEYASMPNVSHGLFLHGEFIYVSMPQGGLGKFRKDDLSFVEHSKYETKALIECISTEASGDHFAVDFSGYLYRGDIDKNMAPVARVAHGACHHMIYDRIHKRYWITDDFHCGLSLFSAENPKNFTRFYLSNDDVEWMSFRPDQSEVLVACFDRHIYRVKNDLEPQVVAKLGPLGYQVVQVVWAEQKFCFALTESGEIYRLDLESGHQITAGTRTNAIWDLKKSFRGDQFWAAFEDGSVREFRLREMALELVREKNLALGMVRRLLPLPDAGLLALTTTGHIVRLNNELQILWSHQTQPLLRDFACDKNQVLFCAETGELTSLDLNDGKVKWQKHFSHALWALALHPNGKNYLVSHRLNGHEDQNRESSPTPAHIFVGNLENGETLSCFPIVGNIKKIKFIDDHHILINGNGWVNTSLLRWPDFQRVKHWAKWQMNTCEAALLAYDKLFTTTYGFQLNTFDQNGESLESAFPFEDYATSLLALGKNRFLAGGRGAFLSLFTLRDGLPHLVSTLRF